MGEIRVNMLICFLLVTLISLVFPEVSPLWRSAVIIFWAALCEYAINRSIGWQDLVADIIGVLGGEVFIFMLGGRIL